MIATNALSNFVPFDIDSAKNLYFTSQNTEEKADLAHKIYRHYLYRGDGEYRLASTWFGHALQNNSPDALVFTYTMTDPNDKTLARAYKNRKPIQPYLYQTLRDIHYPTDDKSRAGYLAFATKKKHPVACQMSSLAIKAAGTYKQNISLLDALQENGMEITHAQSLELQAIALIKGDRIMNNNYGQMIAELDSATPQDRERMAMLEIMGLEVSDALGKDFRTISALGGHDSASSLCFNGIVKNSFSVKGGFERIGIACDYKLLCSLGYQVRRDEERYQKVLTRFDEDTINTYRYSTEQMIHLYEHSIDMLQQRVTPAIRHDLLAPGIFHHKVA